MSALPQLINAFIKKHDALRKVFLPNDAKCFILKSDGPMQPYVQLAELTSGWNLGYSEFRGHSKLEYATLDESFRSKIVVATHYAVDGDVYQIEKGETVPPKGKKPYWRIAGKFTGGKKYVPQS